MKIARKPRYNTLALNRVYILPMGRVREREPSPKLQNVNINKFKVEMDTARERSSPNKDPRQLRCFAKLAHNDWN